MLLGKTKIHELAKQINKTSKEIITVAQELGIDVKSHMSSLEDNEIELVKGKLQSGKENTNIKKTESKEVKKEEPVIIRRQVIISDEEIKRREEEEKKKKQEKQKNNVGFVEKNRKTDYNIVYRNKQTKPMTVSELFGLKTNKQEEPKKEEAKEEIKEEIKETEKIDKKEDVKPNNNMNNTVISKTETKEQPEEKVVEVKEYTKEYNDRNKFNNNRNFNENNRNSFRNNGENNNRQYNNRNFNGENNRPYNNRNNNGENNRPYNNNRNYNGENNRPYNNRNNNFGNNNFNNNGQRNNNRPFNNNRNNNEGYNKKPLDNRGIEKNIKNIMATEIVEKETIRDYSKAISKQKSNTKFEENKAKKQPKNRRDSGEFDEDKLKSLKQEKSLSNMFHDQDGGMLDYYDLTTARGRKNKKKINKDEETKQKIFELKEITIPETISVKDFAAEIKKTTGDVIKKLLGYGIMATLNNDIDFDTAFLIAQEFGITATKKESVTEEDILFDESEDKEEELMPRPPVVVVMGHVDHGKTSLLDAVRSTHVIEGEAGGITQHIGAYKVEVNGREITFLDTPGHEAFTAMRARGAQVTDIAILVVAANDGVMPQTVEAINHAKAAGIPIIVAVNKIDVEGANVERVKEELTKYELVAEEWGGDTIFVPISAKHRTNIDTLLEMVLLVADMKELKANPNKQAKGAVIEAKLDKSRGPVATMLVQRGTLDTGDTIVVGSVIGRIRAMYNDKGKKVKKAGPSTPVEIIGLTEVPVAGETFYEVEDEKTAKHLIERRKRQEREKSINSTAKVSLNDLFSQIERGKLKDLNIIVKADVQGSVEAVKQSLEKLSNNEVQVKVIHANVGGITETDVTLAKVSNAIIIGFNVRPEPLAKDMAEKEEVEIKQYSVIYHAIADVEAAMKGMLDPEYEEKVIGNAEIRQVFKVSNVGTIAGCYVTNGKVSRNAGIRIIRDNVVIHDGKLISLKRFKDDVKEVASGYECGIQIEDFNDIKEGDILEVYVMEEIKK